MKWNEKLEKVQNKLKRCNLLKKYINKSSQKIEGRKKGKL